MSSADINGLLTLLQTIGVNLCRNGNMNAKTSIKCLDPVRTLQTRPH